MEAGGAGIRETAGPAPSVRVRLRRKKFCLKEFPGEDAGHGIAITGSVGRRGTVLSIRYALSGDLSRMAVPGGNGLPERKDRLWEETCLEFFLGVDDSEGYWEFNLSPAGHWNVYRFSQYRKGMRRETAFASLPFDVRIDPGKITLSLDVDTGKIIPDGKAMAVAIGAVIKTVRGEASHWALAHHGPRPDFHGRDGFRLKIPPSAGKVRL